jgi:hypothetical protein
MTLVTFTSWRAERRLRRLRDRLHVFDSLLPRKPVCLIMPQGKTEPVAGSRPLPRYRTAAADRLRGQRRRLGFRPAGRGDLADVVAGGRDPRWAARVMINRRGYRLGASRGGLGLKRNGGAP